MALATLPEAAKKKVHGWVARGEALNYREQKKLTFLVRPLLRF